MKNYRTYRAWLLSFTFLLVSCGTVKEGIVSEKKKLPARTLYANGVYNQVGERRMIILTQKNSKGKDKKTKYYVTKPLYDSLKIGDFYSKD